MNDISKMIPQAILAAGEMTPAELFIALLENYGMKASIVEEIDNDGTGIDIETYVYVFMQPFDENIGDHLASFGNAFHLAKSKGGNICVLINVKPKEKDGTLYGVPTTIEGDVIVMNAVFKGRAHH